MPLKLNIGFSRKVGERDYGSRGASANLELELESGLIEAPDRLRDRVRQLFALAKQSVDEELADRQGSSNGHSGPYPADNRIGHNGNAPNGDREHTRTERNATQSQVRALYAITNRRQLDLAGLLRDRFHVERPGDLRLGDASRLIDELNGAKPSEERRA
jgi:hypothetical protein